MNLFFGEVSMTFLFKKFTLKDFKSCYKISDIKFTTSSTLKFNLYTYVDRSGAFVTFCQNVRKLEILTFCENKMADSKLIRHFVLTKCENFSLSDILTERNKST